MVRYHRGPQGNGRQLAALRFVQSHSPNSMLLNVTGQISELPEQHKLKHAPKYHILASCSTLERPKSSLNGPSMSGPNATQEEVNSSSVHSGRNMHSPYAATKTEVRSAITEVFVIPNSLEIWSLAGAIMEDDTGLINVNAETMAVAAHFLR